MSDRRRRAARCSRGYGTSVGCSLQVPAISQSTFYDTSTLFPSTSSSLTCSKSPPIALSVLVPAGQGSVGDQNFLNAGFHVGINTVGQTLRNANLQLRSEPPNPQVKVSPWLQSTIEPDTNGKPMEIGGQ